MERGKAWHGEEETLSVCLSTCLSVCLSVCLFCGAVIDSLFLRWLWNFGRKEGVDNTVQERLCVKQAEKERERERERERWREKI